MKIKDGVCGLIVGDALGVPVEFKSRSHLKKNPVREMIGYGTYNQVPGTFSDDSSLTLATIDGIFSQEKPLKDGIDYESIIENFLSWFEEGKYTQFNEVFDIGNTTYNAILNYKNGIAPLECGCSDERDNGNGSLMRIIPIVFYIDILNPENKTEIIENISSLTHSHKRSKIACVFFVEICISILNNDFTLKEHIIKSSKKIKEEYFNSDELKYYDRILNEEIFDLEEYEIESSGYVVYTFEAAIWCLINTNNYKDAVLKAVNLGDDTDTIGAICGAIAGLYYGFESIPEKWLNQIRKIDEIIELCNKYERRLLNES